MTFESIICTLQYCLATFEQSCSCGLCGPCTRGQRGIKDAIETLKRLTWTTDAVKAQAPTVLYALERKQTRVEFHDRATLIEFVRDVTPPSLTLRDDATNLDIASMAAQRGWLLIEYQPGECLQPRLLLKLALNTLQELLLTTELNMDDLEAETRQAILRAADFENLAALQGFFHDESATLLPVA